MGVGGDEARQSMLRELKGIHVHFAFPAVQEVHNQ